MVKVTVFTPTYNRAYIIEQLYHSLQNQTCFDFEWLVVDDGSTDDSEELFERWINEETLFRIRYYKKENGGKCRAINTALDYAEGTLFFTVDSDDSLTSDAIEKIIKWEKELPDNRNYCGVAGNLGYSVSDTPNMLFEHDYYDGNMLDRYSHVDGERAFAFYTDIHRNYKYPEFPEEKFMTEAVVWNRMARDGYKMRFYNDIIWIYEYQEDGLTKAGNALFRKNPYGYGLWLKEKAEIQNFSKKEMSMLTYTFTCELEEMYDCKTIARCIRVSTAIVMLCKLIHKIKKILRG